VLHAADRTPQEPVVRLEVILHLAGRKLNACPRSSRGPVCAAKYCAKCAVVQLEKGSPRPRGSVSIACSSLAMYSSVARRGRPLRGLVISPLRPSLS
jgi:hypothetical protein